MPYLGQQPGLGQTQYFTFTTTAGKTLFSGLDDNGYTLNYQTGFCDVFYNGNRLTPGQDYTANDGSTITILSSGITAGGTLFVSASAAFSPSNWITNSIRYVYIATASQTTFSGADSNSRILAYTNGTIQVAVNGLVVPDSDYTANNGSSVILSTGVGVGDIVQIWVLSTLNIANVPTLGANNTFGGNMTVQGQLVPSNSFIKNRIINGGMLISQINAGASVTQTTANLFPVDRFFVTGSVTSKFTAQQSTDAPAGFAYSLAMTSSSAYTVGATEYFIFRQSIEGYNCLGLNWGAANAVGVVLSFWAKSSLTGTFGGCFSNSANARFYPFSYTINVANTWEYKTVVLSGDQSGTWPTDNTAGMNITWSLGTGSTYSGTAGSWSGTTYLSATGAVSVVGTSGATLKITGVQLEAGTIATPFEFRQYGHELALCQRYVCSTFPAGQAWGYNVVFGALNYYSEDASGAPNVMWTFPVPMRTTPSIATYNTNGTNASWRNLSVGDVTPNVDPASTLSHRAVYISAGALSGAGTYCRIQASAYAEL